MVSLRVLVNNIPMDIAFSRARDTRGPINHQLCEVNPPPQAHVRHNLNGSRANPVPFHVIGINGTACDLVKMIAGDHYCIFLQHQTTHMPNNGMSTGLSKEEAELATSLFQEIVSLDQISPPINIVIPQINPNPNPNPDKRPEPQENNVNRSWIQQFLHNHTGEIVAGLIIALLTPIVLFIGGLIFTKLRIKL
jgi:hypothetical protein